MKARERHHLKQNEFAATTVRLASAVMDNRSRLVAGLVVVAVAGAAIGGYAYWRKQRNDAAGAMLGDAIAIEQAQIIPASTLPGATQAAGTYPNEQARSEAALTAFREVEAAHPGMEAATAARYHAAGVLMAMRRYDEAEAAYREVASASDASLYAAVGKLGLAESLARQQKYDDAIAALTELAGDRDGALPVDGVLMQLAEVYVKAGRRDEARATFQRVIDEFAASPYVAEARQRVTAMS
jgi:TolA-binding protein